MKYDTSLRNNVCKYKMSTKKSTKGGGFICKSNPEIFDVIKEKQQINETNIDDIKGIVSNILFKMGKQPSILFSTPPSYIQNERSIMGKSNSDIITFIKRNHNSNLNQYSVIKGLLLTIHNELPDIQDIPKTHNGGKKSSKKVKKTPNKPKI